MSAREGNSRGGKRKTNTRGPVVSKRGEVGQRSSDSNIYQSAHAHSGHPDASINSNDLRGGATKKVSFSSSSPLLPLVHRTKPKEAHLSESTLLDSLESSSYGKLKSKKERNEERVSSSFRHRPPSTPPASLFPSSVVEREAHDETCSDSGRDLDIGLDSCSLEFSFGLLLGHAERERREE